MVTPSTGPAQKMGSVAIDGARIPSTPPSLTQEAHQVQSFRSSMVRLHLMSNALALVNQLAFFGLHRVHSHVCLPQEGFDSFTVMGINCNAHPDGNQRSHPVMANPVADPFPNLLGC